MSTSFIENPTAYFWFEFSEEFAELARSGYQESFGKELAALEIRDAAIFSSLASNTLYIATPIENSRIQWNLVTPFLRKTFFEELDSDNLKYERFITIGQDRYFPQPVD